MTDEQLAIAMALGRASLPMASGVKAFVAQMDHRAKNEPGKAISDKQDAYLRNLAYRFRRQMLSGLLGADSGAKRQVTTLQWLGPEMARAGLLKNDAWVTAAADEAEALFQNQAMKTAAVMIAVLHPSAIDYINQAPVFVMGVMNGNSFKRLKERQFVAERIRPLLENRPKLRELLAAFQLPVQLRALHASALVPSRWRAIRLLSTVQPSTLAQAIPAKPGAQAQWLRNLEAWEATMARRLCSGEDIWLEGRAMHHCVSSYTQSVIAGNCRLFSVRRGDERLATFELQVTAPHPDGDSFWPDAYRIAQIKGPCNAPPTQSVLEAVSKYLKALSTHDWNQ